MTLAALDLSTLTTADRLALIERLWEALEEREGPVTREERDLLGAWLAELDADVAAGRLTGLGWDDVRARCASERGR